VFLQPYAPASWALGQGLKVVASYDVWTGEICLWWSRPKRERPRCGARCQDGTPCDAPPAWNKCLERPVNARCRMHGGFSTEPKTPDGCWRIAQANRSRSTKNTPSGEKRGKSKEVTQRECTT